MPVQVGTRIYRIVTIPNQILIGDRTHSQDWLRYQRRSLRGGSDPDSWVFTHAQENLEADGGRIVLARASLLPIRLDVFLSASKTRGGTMGQHYP